MTKGVCTMILPPPIVYEAVDLGLPSGTKWAAQNVGARKPSDAGLYFQWGDTVGYTADQVGNGEGQKKFSWSDYKWSIDGSSSNFSKYRSNGATLELEDDAAHVHIGGSWHMPTPTQIQELLDNTTSIWTTQDGVNGRLFTSKKDGTKSIFIPAAGYASGGSLIGSGRSGYVWSSLLSPYGINFGQYLRYSSVNVGFDRSGRSIGRSVRGVLSKD